MAQDKKKAELLQGTLDMMELQVLTGGPMHGYAIVRRIQQTSQDMLVVEVVYHTGNIFGPLFFFG